MRFLRTARCRRGAALALVSLCAWTAAAQTAGPVTTPREQFGFNIGDDYCVANYAQLVTYWKKLAGESDRLKLVTIGKTAEGRDQVMAIVTSPENQKHLEHYREIAERLARAESLTDEQAHALAREGKAVVWIDGGLHATESVGSQQLIEWVYQMVSRNDEETLRFLRDTIVLNVPANPDGLDLIANWYMRHSEDPNAPLVPPAQRTMSDLPRLYAKYIGHDDNRDSYMSNMPETTNMNRVMFAEWYPQIMYNHHQTGPPGAVIFIPPFRDPFNYNLDPLIPLGIEMVGTAMHSRLVAAGLGGSAMRSAANYSTWWNGGLRTIAYFHNIIGILTEIIGEPAPIQIPLVADKQLPKGDWPLPVAPQVWHYRQSIDYEMSNNRAIVDLASRYRETFLYNIYVMGKRSIDKGSRDNWTVTPKRIKALEAAAGESAGVAGGGFDASTLPADLYNKVLHDPNYRDPRGYIVPADQPDFANATEFINTLIKNGIDVLRATSEFTVAGKSYPAGSFVVKTAQAFRPHVMDMFEPQDHPNDFRYPGGPPIPPYDITGWTLALQMGVQFDRILDDFSGPFAGVGRTPLPAPAAAVTGVSTPAGYLISHRINNAFIVINRLLKANCDVYWLKDATSVGGQELGAGAIWVPASDTARQVVEEGARQLGVPAHTVAKAPSGAAMKLKPIRIGLYDRYGGLMPSGWTRWLFEQYEFPFQVVYPATLDAGDLKSRFDVLVFTDGAIRLDSGGATGRGAGRRGGSGPTGENTPPEYRAWLGRITADKTVPQLRKFVESGGSIVTIGVSTSLARVFGLPVSNYLTEMGADGRERPLPQEKFYIPGSLLRMQVNNSDPLAYGMPPVVDVFFDSSPVFKLGPSAPLKHTEAVGWFSGPEVLASGWAWGQQYLNGGVGVAAASLGEGKLVLLGPEVNFRDQPHGTYKLLFNGLYYGSAEPATLR